MAVCKIKDLLCELDYCYFYVKIISGKPNLKRKHRLDLMFAQYNKSMHDSRTDADSAFEDTSDTSCASDTSPLDNFIIFRKKRNEDDDSFDLYDNSLQEFEVIEDLCTRSDEKFLPPKKSHNKKVRFDPKPQIHTFYTWDYAYYSARLPLWRYVAYDRLMFEERIANTAMIINRVLRPLHRARIYRQRFRKIKESS